MVAGPNQNLRWTDREKNGEDSDPTSMESTLPANQAQNKPATHQHPVATITGSNAD